MKLRRRVRKPFNRLFRRDYFVTEYLGAKFLLAPGGIGTLEISAGISERPELEFFTAACRELEPDCFVDVGANIGMYSCILLRSGAAPRAIAFEPDARNRAHLGANLLMNGLLDRVDVLPIAAGDAEGRFLLAPGAVDGGFSRIVEEPEPGAYEVCVEPVDRRVSLRGRRLAVKVDVEGFEYRVLAGMQRTLRENKCLVQVECFEPENLFGAMHALGYKLVRDFLPNYVFRN